ncbi:ATP-binding protein [Bifidobacterium platyrrhinorum]|uniref:AAA family ATPase n=1 Tax=Bifidobacterium platyrrhinorum TaxID=2661628 RepID=A0A6L9STH8_9BIFI|nr:ATP-binding protein [Bifidobacterium platyrrhinorum]NEG54842.1 AAA family ATPase [Bifidobacterium platyrrhinorum]
MSIELQHLIQRTLVTRYETQTLEVKAAAEGTPRVYDTLSSFSNQNEGGIILFGIDEHTDFSVCGVYDAQDLQKKVHGQCEAMTPEVRPIFDTAEINGKTVVAAYISGRPMSERPVYRTTKGITEGTYTRLGDADVRMTATELYEIETFKEGRRDDTGTSPEATLDALDKRKTDRFILDATKERPLLSRRTDDEILSLTGATRGDRATLAGMLTLGDYPQRAYPNLCITAIAVNGTTIKPGGDGERFLDNKRYEGTIDEMLEGALSFVAHNSRTKVIVDHGDRRDVPEYPETAVREIIINALMHRDYGPYSNGTPVRLTLFSDRLECWNPGGVYGGQNINDIGYANMPTRNPTLVSLLEIQHIVENRHSGIPVIREEASSHGLRRPEFIDRNGSFLVRFFNETAEPAQIPTSASTSTTMQTHHGAAPADARRTNARQAPGITRDMIMRYCTEPRSAQDIAEHLGYDTAYLRRAFLRPMVDDGMLVTTMPDKPRSKFQKYQAADGGDAPTAPTREDSTA